MSELRRLIRKKDIYDFTGLRRTALEQEIAAGRFPKPFSLTPGGRAKAFDEIEVVKWQEQRLATRQGTDSD